MICRRVAFIFTFRWRTRGRTGYRIICQWERYIFLIFYQRTPGQPKSNQILLYIKYPGVSRIYMYVWQRTSGRTIVSCFKLFPLKPETEIETICRRELVMRMNICLRTLGRTQANLLFQHFKNQRKWQVMNQQGYKFHLMADYGPCADLGPNSS